MAESNLPKKLVCRLMNYWLHDAITDVIFGGCVFMDLEEANCHAYCEKNNILSIYNLSSSNVGSIIKQCENCGK